MSLRLYYDAADGVQYRVHDTVLQQGKHTPVPLGDLDAQYRLFVPRERNLSRRAYRFEAIDSHPVTDSLVDAQFRHAELVSAKRRPSKLTPGRRPE
jgi:hypothetical protein